MKKIVLLFITSLLLVFVMSLSAVASIEEIGEDSSTVVNDVVLQETPIYPKLLQREEGEIVVVLDGRQIIFDVKPTIKSGTTLVPVRAISQALGAMIEWDEDTRTVTIKKDNTIINISIDSKTMYVDSNTVTLNHPAVIIGGRTLVPVRAISEAFGCLVGWDGNTKQVSVIADMRDYCMLYTLDGRSKSFHRSLAPAQLTVGWYEEPLQTLYAPGTSKVFKKSEVPSQLKLGWYEEPVEQIKICVDAGHFGKYNRSNVYPSYYESDMAWKLHLFLKKELEAYGFEVITTRQDKDIDLDRETRGKLSEGCGLFVSLHSNACNVESIDKAVAIPFLDLAWTDIDDKSREIAGKLGLCIKEVMGLSSYQIYPFRDIEDRDRNGVLDDEYYSVLHGSRKVGTPGVILEHGFHTNTKCAKWLSDDNNLEKLAKAEAAVIAEYFGYKKIEQ